MKIVNVGSERALEIIIAPQISEKATFLAEKVRQVIFYVSRDADKTEIKSAVEQIWKSQNIKVKRVQTISIKGKKKRFGRYMGRKSDWKKAFVSLEDGHEIDFTDIRLLGDK